MHESGGIAAWAARVRNGEIAVREVVDRACERIAMSDRPEAWLHVADSAYLADASAALTERIARGEELPLCGVPFAVKDNIDVVGMPTTAGCPAYAYQPARSAVVVERLQQAGAIVLGKTHMDQFATGLVGVRSPHGPCRNPHNARFISGGSSSGSAVVVAQGIVGFALGTDTAGSGRVPAAYCGIVGLKPSRGRISGRGVVPACASLDCVSVFSGTVSDAAMVLEVAAGFDSGDPFSRRIVDWPLRRAFRFGVPRSEDMPELDAEGRALFAKAVESLVRGDGTAVPFDFQPFRETAALLYGGPWVAERLAAVGDFVAANPAAVDATVASILRQGESFSARDLFAASYELRRLRRIVEPLWEEVDVIVVPTAPRAYTIAEALADPLGPSAALGAYNNFANLLDLTALAIPAGMRACGVPFGVTLAAPAGSERNLVDAALRCAEATGVRRAWCATPESISLAVVGAHLSGLPLNGQLLAAGGRLERQAQTASEYRLFALAGGDPPRPALMRVASGGVAIEVEVWRLPPRGFAEVVSAVRAPLAIGRVVLADGAEVAGFVGEPRAFEGALDISDFGGWRAYLAQGSRAKS